MNLLLLLSRDWVLLARGLHVLKDRALDLAAAAPFQVHQLPGPPLVPRVGRLLAAVEALYYRMQGLTSERLS